MTTLITRLSDWIDLRSSSEFDNKTVGFVPTMGALHEGHLHLVRRCQIENDTSVVSIFVNPTQFNNPEDLKKYPRTIEEDLEKLKSVGVNYLLAPQAQDMYPLGYAFHMIENSEWSQSLCGKFRPGHFSGVLTVVAKLFNLVQADRAYFGEKDYQQLNLVARMAEAFFMKTRVVPCETVREADGLAMSSRNVRLSPLDRKIASELYRSLCSSVSLIQIRNHLSLLGFNVEYVEEQWGRRLGAAWLGGVRLIDNVKIPQPAEKRPAEVRL